MLSLKGKTAIVTGAAVRLGKEISLALAGEGVNLCLHYGNSQAEAHRTRDEVRSFGVRAEIIQADFLKPVTAAQRICEMAHDQFGGVDILVNSAAIFGSGSLENTDEANWDRHFSINLKSPFFLTQEFCRLPGSVGTPGRAVVNIVDWRGTNPVPGHLSYTLSKAALVAQTRLLAQELGPQIRVNAVAPGAILPAPGVDQKAFQERANFNPLNQTGSPQDICDAVLFLLKSEFVTGEVIHVTGGEQLAAGMRYLR